MHEVRGFTTATAGLVLAAVMGTAAVVTLPAGALLDRFRVKPILITGNLVSALGYAGLAFVERPWQGFVCSAVGGAGFAVAGKREPTSESDPGHAGAARRLDCPPPSRRQFRHGRRSDGGGLHRRFRRGRSCIPSPARLGGPLRSTRQHREDCR
ncbi:MAG: MFS transporter [Solirubrobacteraceae bacterium]